MARLHRPGEVLRHQPEGEAGRKRPRAYHLRVPGVYDKIELERAATARGARQYGQLELLEALAADLESVGGPAEAKAKALAAVAARRAALEALYARYSAGGFELEEPAGLEAWTAAQEEVAAAGAEVLAELEPQVAAAGGRYARALADSAVYWKLFGLEAARLLLVRAEGVAGLEEDPARGADGGLTEEALALIPEAHWAGLGLFARGLLGPTEQEAKNSASPSPTASNARPSTSAATASARPRSGRSATRKATPTPGTSASSA